jgi:hypothetical protein
MDEKARHRRQQVEARNTRARSGATSVLNGYTGRSGGVTGKKIRGTLGK